MIREYKQGDVVFWRYKENYAKSLHNNRYWCKSKLAIYHDVKGGRFADTYWSNSSSDSFIFKPDDPEIEIVEYYGNLADFKQCTEEVFSYYDREDIVDLRHGNDSRSLYLRKEAIKSAAVMFAAMNEKVKKLQRDIDYALQEKNRIEEIIKNMESGCSLEGIYL